ncbi:hypothetical protein [Psychrobacillus psychrodurans]|uniref:hypothetical protein n=1 Tax=Psychrobacillus psychrodurans TaxID=126157 RepID=UPI003D08912D
MALISLSLNQNELNDSIANYVKLKGRFISIQSKSKDNARALSCMSIILKKSNPELALDLDNLLTICLDHQLHKAV